MRLLIKSLLLSTVAILLIYLSYNILENSKQHIELSKQISKQSDTSTLLHTKVDKILENLTVGLYDNYTKDQTKTKNLIKHADDAQKKALLYLYYLFGTIIIFIAIFKLIDPEFLTLFIGVSSLITLYFALNAPLLMVIVYKDLPIVGLATLSFDTKTIISTIEKLFAGGNYIVATLVLLFSIVIPFLKSIVILVYGFLKESGLGKNIIVLIDKLGKWSMADVFIVSFLVVFFSTKQDIHSLIKIESGLYFFLVYVLLSMIGTSLIGVKKDTYKDITST